MVSTKLLNTYKKLEKLCAAEGISVTTGIKRCKAELRPPRDEKFREKAYEFVEQRFRTINDESALDIPISIDGQKDICLETLCFVHETGSNSIVAIMGDLDKKAINYKKMSSNIAVLINYLYYLYTGKFESLYIRWNSKTKDNLKKMITVIENHCE